MAMRWQDDNAPAAIAQITPGMSRPLAFLLGKILRRKLTRATREQGLGRLPDEVLNREVENVLADVSAMLGESPFFLADTLSAADLAMHGQFGFGLSGSTPAFAKAFAQHENLKQFQQRVTTLVESRKLS
jgi:glutathione S-transferase